MRHTFYPQLEELHIRRMKQEFFMKMNLLQDQSKKKANRLESTVVLREPG